MRGLPPMSLPPQSFPHVIPPSCHCEERSDEATSPIMEIASLALAMTGMRGGSTRSHPALSRSHPALGRSHPALIPGALNIDPWAPPPPHPASPPPGAERGVEAALRVSSPPPGAERPVEQLSFSFR